ncbi:MAG: hypothetical protein AAF725_19090 [Acidobacteriota bacterium]
MIRTGSAATPLETLTSSSPSEVFRTSGVSSMLDTWIAWDGDGPRPVAGVAAPNTNATSSALKRIRLSNLERIIQPDYVPPVFGQRSNIGADADAEGGPTETLSAGDSWTCGFAAPPNTPFGGLNVQRIRLRARSTGDTPAVLKISVLGGAAGGDPALGQVVAEQIITASFNGVRETLFDYAPWLDPDASARLEGVAVKIEALPRDDRFTPAPWELQAIEWRAEHIEHDVDTGYIPMIADPQSYSGLTISELARKKLQTDAGWVLLDSQGGLDPGEYRYGRIDILDTQNPDGYLELGGLAVGPGMALELQTDHAISVADLSVTERTVDGTAWTQIRPGYLAARLPFVTTSRVGVVDVLQGLYLAQGSAGNFLVSILPEDPDAGILTFWAFMPGGVDKSISYLPQIRHDTHQPWSWASTLTVEQRR